jgi:hypothetical protein
MAGSDQWADRVGRVLANLGFYLDEADPSNRETNHLLVALRPAPTLEHFDPESIAYWVSESGRGRPAGLDRQTRLPIDGAYAWGRIEVLDRLDVSNQFLSFGGTLRAETAPDSTVLVDFGSLAPILRWSGHSQGLDPLTAQVGAFFARVKVPIDFEPGAEGLVAAASPRALYCAFIQSVRERLARARSLSESNRWLAGFSARESQRLEAVADDDWRAAQELRRQLGLTGADSAG